MKFIAISALTAAAFAGTLAAQSIPDITFDGNPNLLKTPVDLYIGEAAGVATNSKGHIFLFTRTGNEYATTGTSRTFVHGGGRLLEFDANGTYLREIGQGLYGFLYPQAVKIDSQDNIWVVDRGASVVIKFDPSGRVIWPMGRKPENITVGPARGAGEGGGGRGAAAGGRAGAAPAGGGRGRGGPPGAGTPGDLFSQPSDVAFDSAGNIYIADGYGNNDRIAKFDKNSHFIKSWGQRGSEPGQFDHPSSINIDANGNLYVTDLGNKRIQVFDTDGNFKTQFTGFGSPMTACISPGPHQYLYVSNSNPVNSLDDGEIYKMELDGKILGKFGEAGKLPKQFGTVNQIDCRKPNELLVGEVLNWRVQKVTLHP